MIFSRYYTPVKLIIASIIPLITLLILLWTHKTWAETLPNGHLVFHCQNGKLCKDLDEALLAHPGENIEVNLITIALRRWRRPCAYLVTLLIVKGYMVIYVMPALCGITREPMNGRWIRMIGGCDDFQKL